MTLQEELDYKANFDQTVIDNAGTPTQMSDLSRLIENSGGRYVEEAMFRVQAQFPGKHITPKLTDGVYVVGWLKKDSICRRGTALVKDKWDNAVTVSLGIPGKPTLFVNGFDGSQATGTTTVIDDCNEYLPADTPVIMTIAGTAPTMKVGEVVCLVEFSKLATRTYMPSN